MSKRLHNRLVREKINKLIKERESNNIFINLFEEENDSINKRIIELRTKIK